MDKQYIVMRESVVRSIICDAITFGCMFGGLFLNYKYLGDSSIIKIFFLIFVPLFAAQATNKIKSVRNFISLDEAIKFLEQQKTKGVYSYADIQEDMYKRLRSS